MMHIPPKCTDARPCVSTPDSHRADPAALPVEAGAPQPASTPPIRRRRGRPRIHPPRDPDAPKRPRGRPAGSKNRTCTRPPCTDARPCVSTPRKRGRPPGSKNFAAATPRPAPHIIISDQRVTWAFIKLIYKRLRCDWDDTIDAFWKARHTTGSNAIQRYIMAGFKPGKNGRPWILQPSREREEGKMENLREWWIQLYRPSRQCTDARPCVSTGMPDIASMIEQLSQGMSF